MGYNIFRKCRTVIAIIRLYKTWRLAILDKYGLLNGMITHVLRNNTRYLVRPGIDTTKINSIYFVKEYHEHLNKIKENSVVIDIGAHIGVFSVFASRLAKNVKVYSYEPFKESFGLLKKNIRLNNMERNISAFNIGVSGKKEIRKLFLNEKHPGSNSMYIETGETIQIKTISLKDIFEENNLSRCDFLKMDCEGTEYEILYNAPKECLDRIKSISMEYHETGDINELIKFLENNRFKTRRRKAKAFLLYAEKI